MQNEGSQDFTLCPQKHGHKAYLGLTFTSSSFIGPTTSDLSLRPAAQSLCTIMTCKWLSLEPYNLSKL